MNVKCEWKTNRVLAVINSSKQRSKFVCLVMTWKQSDIVSTGVLPLKDTDVHLSEPGVSGALGNVYESSGIMFTARYELNLCL